jgi:hypothetical protein
LEEGIEELQLAIKEQSTALDDESDASETTLCKSALQYSYIC